MARAAALLVAAAVLFVVVLVPLTGAGSRGAQRADLFVVPRGTDAGRCTSRRPCRTLQRAYRVARPGDTVELAGGVYPAQQLRPLRRSRGPRVVFRPATGAHAAVARLELEAGVADIELRNLHFPNGWTLGPADDGVPARNVVFRRTTGARFTIQNGRRITIVGGSYGPSLDAPSQIKTYNPESRRMPVDITVSGVRFHDYSRSDDSVHTECLQVYAGQRVVIRNSRFTRCDGTGALALTTLSGTTLRRVIVENNWFDETGDAYDAVQADGSVRDLLFRYNSATKSVIFTGCEDGPCGPARVVANYLPYNPSLCQSGVGYSHNVLAGGRCGGTDVAVHRLSFVDARGFDLHLTPSSAARCRGARDDFPARDIDGQRRPRRYRADAGADQLTGTPGGPSVPRRCRVR